MGKIKEYVHAIVENSYVFVPNEDVVSFVNFCKNKFLILGGAVENGGRYFYI